MKNALHLTILVILLFSIPSCKSRKLNLVIIGGVFAGNDIPQAYETVVAEKMGMEANTFSWIKVNEKPEELHENMRVNSELREAVANADVILMTISPNWSNSVELRYILDVCGGEDDQDCLRETLIKTKCDWKGIMDVVEELRAERPVVFQTILWGDWIFPAFHGDDVTPEQISVMASYYNEFQDFQATTPGIEIVTVFPETYADLPPHYFRTDGSHQLSEAGSLAAIDLLVAAGFEQTAPGSPDLNAANVNCASAPQ